MIRYLRTRGTGSLPPYCIILIDDDGYTMTYENGRQSRDPHAGYTGAEFALYVAKVGWTEIKTCEYKRLLRQRTRTTR